MFIQRALQTKLLGPAALMLAGSLLLSGCAFSGAGSIATSTAAASSGSTTSAVQSTGGISGVVHGGAQAVTNATVALWTPGTSAAAGTYGTGATLVATTTTDSNGKFSLSNQTASVTAYSISGYDSVAGTGTATFTTSTDTFAPTAGESLTLSGFPNSTFLNGQTVTVAASPAPTTTQFTAVVTATGNVSSTTEAGTGSYVFAPCPTGSNAYITVTGGKAGSTTNNSLALMAALPQTCSSSSANTTLVINEVTTIAAVTALQQFMSINTSATVPYAGTGTAPWTIGAPSTNTAGLTNAFLQAGLLANISTGYSVTSYQANTVNSVVYTTTVLPDYTKIYGLADVLTICINDTTGNLCTGSAGVLTQTTIGTGSGTSATYTVPVDTIQAAYNMATLPNAALYSGSGTTKYWKNSTSSATYLSNLWPNISAVTAFQPYSASAPPDTAIGVSWKCLNPNNGAVGTVYAASVAIDGNGDIWVGGGSGVTGNYITQFNQYGQLLQTVSSVSVPTYTLTFYPDSTTPVTGTVAANATQALGYGRPQYSLAIDTNNNAWFDAYGATSSNGTLTLGTSTSFPTGVLAEVTQSGTATGVLTGSSPGALAIDPSNNVFTEDIPTSGRNYMGMVSAGASYHTVDEGVARATSIYNGIAIDSNSYAWIFSSVCTTGEVVYRVNAATMPTLTTYTTSSDVVLASGAPCMVVGAGDKNGNMWATDGTNINYVSITAPNSVSSPVVTQAFVSGSGTGLYVPNGMAVDGSGNLWVVNKGATATVGSAGAAEFQTNGTAGTATLLSTTGTASEGFGSDTSLYLGAPENLVIDSSGNVWFATTGGSYLYYVVGVASPVKTPLASMYSSIATKP